MIQQNRIKDPLAEIERSAQEEIEKFKWIESEKLGRDIGWDRARREWLGRHFQAWKRNRWNHALAEALDQPGSLN